MRHTQIKIHPNNDKTPIKKAVGQLSVDIYHTEKEIVILAPIAGVNEEDLKLSITDDVLVIKGDREKPEETEEENYYTKECFWGPFSRSIVLPEEADIQNINADFKKNILEIRIPRLKVEHTKIIKIKKDK